MRTDGVYLKCGTEEDSEREMEGKIRRKREGKGRRIGELEKWVSVVGSKGHDGLLLPCLILTCSCLFFPPNLHVASEDEGTLIPAFSLLFFFGIIQYHVWSFCFCSCSNF